MVKYWEINTDSHIKTVGNLNDDHYSNTIFKMNKYDSISFGEYCIYTI